MMNARGWGNSFFSFSLLQLSVALFLQRGGGRPSFIVCTYFYYRAYGRSFTGKFAAFLLASVVYSALFLPLIF